MHTPPEALPRWKTALRLLRAIAALPEADPGRAGRIGEARAFFEGSGVDRLRQLARLLEPGLTDRQLLCAIVRVERVAADQFNHCVVARPKDDGTYQMLDPTWVPLSPELWSSAEGEQHYLIGTPEGRRLEQTPAFEPAEEVALRGAEEAVVRELVPGVVRHRRFLSFGGWRRCLQPVR